MAASKSTTSKAKAKTGPKPKKLTFTKAKLRAVLAGIRKGRDARWETIEATYNLTAGGYGNQVLEEAHAALVNSAKADGMDPENDPDFPARGTLHSYVTVWGAVLKGREASGNTGLPSIPWSKVKDLASVMDDGDVATEAWGNPVDHERLSQAVSAAREAKAKAPDSSKRGAKVNAKAGQDRKARDKAKKSETVVTDLTDVLKAKGSSKDLKVNQASVLRSAMMNASKDVIAMAWEGVTSHKRKVWIEAIASTIPEAKASAEEAKILALRDAASKAS